MLIFNSINIQKLNDKQNHSG
uniref:Uncharacterized protein n=1 Tax=Anguilla anguilla TaxID=7936 RepID=A0A0E9R3W2_ANGAN